MEAYIDAKTISSVVEVEDVTTDPLAVNGVTSSMADLMKQCIDRLEKLEMKSDTLTTRNNGPTADANNKNIFSLAHRQHPYSSGCEMKTMATSEVIANQHRLWLLEGKSSIQSLVVARAVVEPTGSRFPVRLLNFSDLPCTLHQGTRIGILQQLHESQVHVSAVTPTETSSIDPAQPASVCGEKLKILKQLLDASGSTLLTEDQKEAFKSLVLQYADIFFCREDNLGHTSKLCHSIDTGSAPPIRQHVRRIPPAQRTLVKDLLDDMLHKDIIQPSQSPWASPIVLARKKDGSVRFCADYRKVNEVTRKDAYPLPQINDTLETLSDSKIFSTLDLASGYWQVVLTENDRQKTAFCTTEGLYEFKVMPFGLCNAPATFQRLMDIGLQWTSCLVYLDDIIVLGRTFTEHLSNLGSVFSRIHDAGLKIKPEKCSFLKEKVKYLGHIVSKEGIAADPEKTATVKAWPTPTSTKEVQQFLGLANYYRRFIKDFAQIAKPLHKLTERTSSFLWTTECKKSFEILLHLLSSPPILSYPDFTKPFNLDTDASNDGIGGVLSQLDKDGREHVVAYGSHLLTKPERNYCVTRKELLAVVTFCGLNEEVIQEEGSSVAVVQLSGLSAEEILNNQREDQDLKTIIEAKMTQTRPPNPKPKTGQCLEQRRLLQLWDHLLLRNGLLYHKCIDRKHPSRVQYQLEVPPKLRSQVLKEIHEGAMGGHLGEEKTLQKLKDRFYWPGHWKSVQEWCHTCPACSQRKTPTPKNLAPLQSVTVSSPMQMVAIDILGPLPVTLAGNKYILVAADYFSKWIEAYAIPNQEATTIARKLLCFAVLLCLKNFIQTRADNLKQRIHGKPFDKGELVWLFNPAIKKGQSQKFHRPWGGPYRICEKLSDVTYHVQHTGNNKCKVVHFNWLKKCPENIRLLPRKPTTGARDPPPQPVSPPPVGSSLELLEDDDVDQGVVNSIPNGHPPAAQPNGRYPFLQYYINMIYTDEECADLSHNAWYLDDGSLAGKSASVLRALNIVSSQGPALGFNISFKKCELYGTGDLSSFPSAIQTSNTNHLELLGAPIGDSEYCNQFISRKHQAALALLSTLEEIGSLDPQVALALLHLCSGFCKLIHIARVTPPHLILDAMQRYDADIRRSFANCTGVDASDTAWKQAKLSLRRVGASLTS
ncbi:hypothetical protein EMCRGX_G025580 [Ephydatia muelleri]